jgi:hypothetical protein
MAHGKLDMGKAWTQATALMGLNRDTIGAIAGLFFFLPSMASALFVPVTAITPAPPAGSGGEDPAVVMQAAVDQMTALYADNWPILLAVFAMQFIGSMSLFALLTDRGNPTVGEALATGIKGLPSYIAAQLITVIGASLAIGLPLGLVSALGGEAVAVLAVLAALVAIIYLMVKVSLAAPVIAIEGQRNPFTALVRSWQLTKGNSVRIAVFIALLVVVIGIISTLVSGIITLILAAVGGGVATIGGAALNALVNALLTALFVVVTVAIYRQLSDDLPQRAADVFE